MAGQTWWTAEADGGWEELGIPHADGRPAPRPRWEPEPRPAIYDFYDDMSLHADGTATAEAVTGQQWRVFQVGTVVDGYFDSTSTSAAYLEAVVKPGKRVLRMGAEWMFDDHDKQLTASGTLCLVSWADGGIVANGFGRRTSMHVTITQNAIQWYIRTETPGSQASVTLLSTQVFAEKLPPNKLITVNIEVDFANHFGTVVFSNGRRYTWYDTRIVGYPDEIYACWEPFYSGNALASRVRIAKIWADSE
jgi:hypothetical protein